MHVCVFLFLNACTIMHFCDFYIYKNGLEKIGQLTISFGRITKLIIDSPAATTRTTKAAKLKMKPSVKKVYDFDIAIIMKVSKLSKADRIRKNNLTHKITGPELKQLGFDEIYVKFSLAEVTRIECHNGNLVWQKLELGKYALTEIVKWIIVTTMTVILTTALLKTRASDSNIPEKKNTTPELQSKFK
jgi:hypothetical protein